MEKSLTLETKVSNTLIKGQTALQILANSAIYSAIDAPLTGLTQIVDKVSGSHLSKVVKHTAETLGIKTPGSEKFGTLNWAAYELGSAAGMMLPFMTIYKGLSITNDSLLIDSSSALTDKLALTDTMALAKREALRSGVSGFIYGSVLQPTAANSHFLADRFSNGITDAASFGVLGLSNSLLSSSLGKLATSVQESALSPLVKTPIQSLINNPLNAGLLASIPTGISNAEINALANHKLIASSNAIKQDILTMAFIGGSFGLANRFTLEHSSTNPTINLANTQGLTFENSQALTLKNSELPHDTLKPSPKPHDLVLGVGGVIGAYEGAGAIKALDEQHLHFDKVSGGSAGAGLATLYTNGFTAEEILKTNLDSRLRMLTNPFLMWDSLILPEPKQWNVSRSMISLEHPWLEQIQKLNLKPNSHLQIWAYDPINDKPVLFKGQNYDLAKALAATGAYPHIFAAIMHEGNALIDGGFYRANTDEFSHNDSIVLKFTGNPELNTEVTKPSSIVIDLRRNDINALDFGLSEAKCRELFEDGYKKTTQALLQAQKMGKL